MFKWFKSITLCSHGSDLKNFLNESVSSNEPTPVKSPAKSAILEG